MNFGFLAKFKLLILILGSNSSPPDESLFRFVGLTSVLSLNWVNELSPLVIAW